MTNNLRDPALEILKALRCCQNRQCAMCLYRGRGIACKYHLMDATAALIEQLAAEMQQPAPEEAIRAEAAIQKGGTYETDSV